MKFFLAAVALALPFSADANVTCRLTFEGVSISISDPTDEKASEHVRACRELWKCALLNRCNTGVRVKTEGHP